MSVAGELYALPPDEFTAARDSAARSARDDGHRDLAETIKSWRRPSVGAWLVNQVVRAHPDELDDLLDLGVSLREAQHALDGVTLRTLSRERHQVIRGLSDLGRRIATDRGQKVGDAPLREFEATLEAALTDAHAAEAMRTGRLMRPLATAGLDPVDLDGAVADPDDPAPPRATRSRKKPARAATADRNSSASTTRATAKDEAERRAAEATATRALDDAEKALADHERTRDDARATFTEAKTEVGRLEAALEDARRAMSDADTARRESEQGVTGARRARDAAKRAVDRVRTERT